ncbi:MAG: tRNA 4-thiouridine(8) synthase ThiI [Patescibacteria group bacterium]|nr:tRNA 4-thiouridine(8) synthase ThiI [Patescibacteria group bacterium]
MDKKITSKTPKHALILFSGGLDSLLVARIMENLGFKITALIFQSCFFSPKVALDMTSKYNFKIITKNISKQQLEIVKCPRFGYGKNINPCLDCRLLMLKTAKKIARKEKFSIIVTGEVLGQRPMSQNRRAFTLIEKESGLENNILRPLSGKLLPKTIYERDGLINRNKLYEILGKNRQKQLGLLEKYKITEYPTPSGGCLLTDPEFSHRLKTLLQKNPNCKINDIQLLKQGRLFWDKKNLIVVGRDEADNQQLEKTYRKSTDVLMELVEYPGPLMLIRNFGNKKPTISKLKEVGKMLIRYCSKVKGKRNLKVRVRQLDEDRTILVNNIF